MDDQTSPNQTAAAEVLPTQSFEQAHIPQSTSHALEQVDTLYQENALVEFSYFPLLPIELRLKVWEEVPRVPRTIELIVAYDAKGTTFLSRYHGFHCYPPCNAVPALLHTNLEARHTAMNGGYKLLFIDVVVYFDVSLDTLSLGGNNTEDEIMSPNRFRDTLQDRIQRIVVSIEEMITHRQLVNYSFFRNLRELVVLVVLETTDDECLKLFESQACLNAIRKWKWDWERIAGAAPVMRFITLTKIEAVFEEVMEGPDGKMGSRELVYWSRSLTDQEYYRYTMGVDIE